VQATAFSLKLAGAASLAFQVPWNPKEMLPPGLITPAPPVLYVGLSEGVGLGVLVGVAVGVGLGVGVGVEPAMYCAVQPGSPMKGGLKLLLAAGRSDDDPPTRVINGTGGAVV
jgi:hypothetical protein